MKALLVLAVGLFVACLVAGSVLAGQPFALLPEVGQSQTFAVSSVMEMAGLQMPPDAGGAHNIKGGESPNQHGTLVLKRSASNAVQATTSGDLTVIDQSVAVGDNGTLNYGSSSNIFLAALNNAAKIIASMPAGSAVAGQKWDATIEALGYQGVKQLLTVHASASKAGVDAFAITAQGKTSKSAGVNSVGFGAEINAKISSGRLTEYQQKISSSVDSPMGAMSFDLNTTLSAVAK